mgnify:CR=1 FL=1
MPPTDAAVANTAGRAQTARRARNPQAESPAPENGAGRAGDTKPDTLETGAEVAVPLFVEQGTKSKVDTRDGSYLGRVN